MSAICMGRSSNTATVEEPGHPVILRVRQQAARNESRQHLEVEEIVGLEVFSAVVRAMHEDAHGISARHQRHLRNRIGEGVLWAHREWLDAFLAAVQRRHVY